jgi:hypothetical protein
LTGPSPKRTISIYPKVSGASGRVILPADDHQTKLHAQLIR